MKKKNITSAIILTSLLSGAILLPITNAGHYKNNKVNPIIKKIEKNI